MVTASWRSLRATSSKLKGLELLEWLSSRVPDSYKLDRFVPFVVSSLLDSEAIVRVSAIRTLAAIVQTVTSVRASDLNLFPGYIFPNIVESNKKYSEVFFQVAYAENLATLAKSAQRFLEIAQLESMQKGAAAPELSAAGVELMGYDGELQPLQMLVQEELVAIMKESVVKQTLLDSSVTSLCTFFGPAKVGEALLCHMFTFFNEKRDWPLRYAFFKSIVAVVAYSGSMMEILPFIERSLSDSEEFVVEQTLNAMTSLVELHLLQKTDIIDLVRKTAPLLMHPGVWIRYATVAFLSAVAKNLSILDVHCTIKPLLERYFVYTILDYSNEALMIDALKPEIPRQVFEAVVKSPDVELIFDALLDKKMKKEMGSPMTNARHEQCVRSLQELGMSVDVEEKILGMQEMITKVWRERIRLAEDVDPDKAKKTSRMIRLDVNKVKSLPTPPSDVAVEASESNPSIDLGGSMSGLSLSRVHQSGSQSDAAGNGTASSKDAPNPTQPFELYRASMKKQIGRRRHFAKHGPAHTPLVSPQVVSKGKKAKLAAEARDRDANALRSWRPSGRMVGHMVEHKAPINKLVLLPDQRFFLTASDDATVRLWDCSRLEGRDVTNRSKLQYTEQKAGIRHVAVCDNGRLVGSAANDGSLHLFHVDRTDSTVRERSLDLQVSGHIVDLKPLGESSPVMIYATVAGYVVGWDTRTAEDGWSFKACPHHGLIQSLLVDRTQSCLTYGGSRGVYSLWDLRFQLPVKSWLQPGESRIQHLEHFPSIASTANRGTTSADSSSWIVSAAGPNQAYLWDMKMSKIVCTFRATPVMEDTEMFSLRSQGSKPYSALLDSQSAKRPSSIVPPRSAFEFYKLKLQRQLRHNPGEASASQKGQEERWNSMSKEEMSPFKKKEVEDALRYQDELTECLGNPWISTPKENPDSVPFTAVCTHPRNSAVYLGSADGRIRIWDLDKPRDSYILGDIRSGSSIRPGAETTYEVAKGTARREVTELIGSESRIRTTNGTKSETGRVGHCGMVSGMALITAPDKLLVSCSRDGAVKIWK